MLNFLKCGLVLVLMSILQIGYASNDARSEVKVSNNSKAFNLSCEMKDGNPKKFYAPGPKKNTSNYQLIYDYSNKPMCPKTHGKFLCKICQKNDCKSGQVLAYFEGKYKHSYPDCNQAKPGKTKCEVHKKTGPISVNVSKLYRNRQLTCSFTVKSLVKRNN